MEEKIMSALKEAKFNPVIDEFGYISFEKGQIGTRYGPYCKSADGSIIVMFDDIKASYLKYTNQNCVMLFLDNHCVSSIIN